MTAKVIERELGSLAAIRSDPTAAGSVALLQASLDSKSNLVVAKAAAIVQASEQSAFCPAMAAALPRFFVAGSDKGCGAKTALTEALYTLGHGDAEAFLPGVTHVQRDGYGASGDSAVDLRGYSALGLARAGYKDVLLVLGEMLADEQAACRQVAVRAMAYAGSDAAAPLLRYKVLAGDPEPGVTAECFAALMKLAPRASMAFVGRFVEPSDPDRAAAAAVAIGEARSAVGWAFLLAAWQASVDPALRAVLLPAMALTRQPQAIDFLLDRVATDRPDPAAAAVAALALFKRDAALRDRLAAAAARNGHPTVRAAVDRLDR